MNRTRLSETEILRRAAEWADELFAPGVSAVLVRYESGGRGRRNKPSVVQAEREIDLALRGNDVQAARAGLQRAAAAVPDPGLALCESREALAAVLAERLRRGEYCFADDKVGALAVAVTVWRE